MTGTVVTACFVTGLITGWFLRTVFVMAEISRSQKRCRTRSSSGSPRRSTPDTRQRVLHACSEHSDIQPAMRTTSPRLMRTRRQ